MVEHGPLLARGKLGCREHDRMERDVVLSDELEQVRSLGIEPPLLPVVREVGCNRYVADRSVEPDIEDLVLVARFRNGNAPLEITGYAPFLQAVAEPALCDLNCVLCPEALLRGIVDPALENRQDLGQVQVEVLGLPDDGSGSADHAAGIDQLCGIQKGLAGIALVSAGIGRSAVRAGALHEAVG